MTSKASVKNAAKPNDVIENAETLITMQAARKQAEARGYIEYNDTGKVENVVPCAALMTLLLARGINEEKTPAAILTRLGQKLFPILGKYTADGEIQYSDTVSKTRGASVLVKHFLRDNADASDKLSLVSSVAFPSEIAFIASYIASKAITAGDYTAIFGTKFGPLVKAVYDAQGKLWEAMTVQVRELTPIAHRTEQSDTAAAQNKADKLTNRLAALGLLPQQETEKPKATPTEKPKAVNAAEKERASKILADIAAQAAKP